MCPQVSAPGVTSSGGPSALTIGVFDSGFGGLTVLRELLPLLPESHCLYLGDTARLPYGAKSRATVARYAIEAARFLVDNGAQSLVIACNTATALALEDIREAVPVPVFGVIGPGAQAARTFAETAGSPEPRETLVLATTATVGSHAYRDTCASFGLQATEKACPLLVPLVEEGWIDHPVTRDVLRIYLREALAVCSPASVLLGCTHYPLLAEPIRAALRELGSSAVVIDSAAATARAVAEALLAGRPWDRETSASTHARVDRVPDTHFECFATDSVEKFARLGSLFLGRPIPDVRLLDLGG